MASTLNFSAIFPEGSNATTNGGAKSRRKSSAGLRVLSRLIATTMNPLGEYALYIDTIQGKDWRQGAHHEAQKSIHTTFPRNDSSEMLPDCVGRLKPGASSGR